MTFDLAEIEAPGEGAAAPKRAPFALVLGCSDARVPTELVFGQGWNDMFVVRVAGNVLGSECLGSIDYAVSHLHTSLRLLVVLGHSGCGAVAACVDAYLNPANYLDLATSHSLRSVVDRISIAVRAAARSLESAYGADVTTRPGYKQALADATVVVHAALTAHTLELEFEGRPDCQVAFGVYDLGTRRVGLEPAPDGLRRGAHLVGARRALGRARHAARHERRGAAALHEERARDGARLYRRQEGLAPPRLTSSR